MARKVKLSKIELLDRSIERWEAKQEAAVIMLRKSAEELLKLRRQRARRQRKLLTAKEVVALTTPPEPEPEPEQPQPTLGESCDVIVSDMIQGKTFEQTADDDIPTFLDRNRQLQAMADPRTPEKKAQRREVERQKREADLRGQTRKLPLMGKAALAAINAPEAKPVKVSKKAKPGSERAALKHTPPSATKQA